MNITDNKILAISTLDFSLVFNRYLSAHIVTTVTKYVVRKILNRTKDYRGSK